MPPGRLYQLWLFVVGSVAAIEVLFVFVPQDWDIESRLGILLFFGMILLGSLAVASYLRGERLVAVDRRGVRLFRGGKLAKELSWDRVGRVQYGTVPFSRGMTSIGAAYFAVYGRGTGSIQVLENNYRVARGSVGRFAEEVTEVARSRGIPVVKKDSLPGRR